MKKSLIFLVLISLLVFFVACSTQEKTVPVENVPQTEPTVPQPPQEETQPVVPQKKEDVEKTVSESKSFTVKASKFTFEPSTITVKKGDTVTLTLTSTDVTHGFSLSAFNVNANLEQGKTETVTFVADKEGTFPFACSVYCGSGHSEMRGTLVVEP